MSRSLLNWSRAWPVLLALASLLALSSTLTSTAAQGTERFGNVLFRVPPGWTRVDENGAVLLVPLELQGMFAGGQGVLVTILPGEPLKSDVRAWFEAKRRELEAGLRVLERGEALTDRSTQGFELLSASSTLQEAGGAMQYRLYIAAHPGQRAEMFVYIATSQEWSGQYQPGLEAFIRSVSFANLAQDTTPAPASPANPPSPTSKPNPPSPTGKPPAPPPGAGGLQGLYARSDLRQQFNAFTGLYDSRVVWTYYYFLPNGYALNALPHGGPESLDCTKLTKEGKPPCLTYKITGNRIQFEGAAPLEFRREANGIVIGKTSLRFAEPLRNYRLEGRYGSSSFVNTSNTATGAQGNVSGERTITFTRDGRFRLERFTGFASGTADVGVTGSNTNAPITGTYRIDGYTLELAYADGRRERLTFFLPDGRGGRDSPGIVSLDGAGFLRR